jgi:hypothetical protein
MEPLYLWPQGRFPAGQNRPLGSLRITHLDGPSAGQGGLRIGVEFRPPETATESRRLVLLLPSIVSAQLTRRTHGRILRTSDPFDQQGLLGAQTTTHWWAWLLTADEIELIESERSAGAEVMVLNLVVAGVATVGAETWGFEGESQLAIGISDWVTLLRSLGYLTPPTLQDAAGRSLTLAPAWGWAEDKIKEARRHLMLGEDREALSIAYRAFDAMSPNPYKSAWDELLKDAGVPTEKAAVIRSLLQAQAQLLNKLGRHPSFDGSAGSDRTMLPLDHWEAELAIGLAQMLLAGAQRWRELRATQPIDTATVHESTDGDLESG